MSGNCVFETVGASALHLLLLLGWTWLGDVLLQPPERGILVLTTLRCWKVGASDHTPCARTHHHTLVFTREELNIDRNLKQESRVRRQSALAVLTVPPVSV